MHFIFSWIKTLLLLLFYARIFKLQLVFVKIMWVFPNMDTAEISSFCWSQSVGLQKHLFYMTSSQGRSSVPSSTLLCVNIVKLSWIPLFHTRACCMPSFWVTETSALRSVNITSQIWPNRGYTRSWYTGTSHLKKWLQALPPFLSPASSNFIFTFAFSQPVDPTTSEPGIGYSSADQCLTNWANHVVVRSITRRTSWKQTPLES